jgi:hypothetical protein
MEKALGELRGHLGNVRPEMRAGCFLTNYYKSFMQIDSWRGKTTQIIFYSMPTSMSFKFDPLTTPG